MFLKIKNNFGLILLIFFISFIYFLTLRGVNGNLYPNGKGNEKIISNTPPFETSLERGRYAQTIAIAENHTFILDKFRNFIKPDLAWYNGHYFSPFPPGVSVLATPFYLIGKKTQLNQLFTFSTSAIFSILTGIILIFIGKKINFSNRSIALMLLVYLVASNGWAYGVTFSAHPISAFIISTFFLLGLNIKPGKNNILNFILLGFLYGLNFYIDYPNLFILIPLLIWAVFKSFSSHNEKENYEISIPSSLLFIILSFLVSLIPFFIFNFHYYHKWIALTNSYNLKALEERGVTFSYNHLSNSLFNKKSYSTRFDFMSIPRGIFTLIFSSDRGLLFFFPIYIFGFLGFIMGLFKKNKFIIPLFLTFLFDLLLYGSFNDPWGGWAFGPRYLIPVLPLFAIFIGLAFEYLEKRTIFKIIFSFLFIFSSIVALAGALTTNAVPPIIENIPNTPTNFMLNFQFLMNNMTSSFFYNTFLRHILSPFSYYLALLSVTILVILFIIWLPLLHIAKNTKM